ncbi:MAG: hypothetical protein ACRCYA_11155 [Cetobacterium sp.]|uniref:hypothetical protein n=1 Tax=Cetobacterium sp. TaxID=2071632 RepID=UPI003F3F9855
MIKKIVMIMMLILNIISFSKEVPHTYIYDNPEKAITTAETLKKKPNGAEMNISVTKIKSKEIMGYINNGKIYIPLNEELKNNNVVVTTKNKNTRTKRSLKTSNNSNTVNFEKENGKLITDYTKDNLYINVLGSERNLKNLYKVNLLSSIGNIKGHRVYNYSMNLEIDDRYDGAWIEKIGRNGAYATYGTVTNQGLKFINGSYVLSQSLGDEKYNIFPKVTPDLGSNSESNLIYVGEIYINNQKVYQAPPYNPKKQYINGYKYDLVASYQNGQATLEDLIVQVASKSNGRELLVKLNKNPTIDLAVNIKVNGISGRSNTNQGTSGATVIDYYTVENNIRLNFKSIIRTFIGSSTLTFNESYNKSFVNFNADNNGSSLGVENSVPGLNFGTSGAGIAFLQQGDILELNGARVIIGASGNLGETQGSIGTLGYKYKAENGKLRLALTNWGVLEPSRTFEVKVLKGGSEAVRHTFTIQAPKRVEGTSRVKFVETYPNTQFVAFNGVSLNSPTALSLENSVTGVTLESSTGAGLVTMQQGDILEINGVQNQIGASGTLGEKNISLGSLALNYAVQGGKLRIRPISWGVQEPQREATVRIIRGTNEISKQVISIQAPKRVEGTSRVKFVETYPNTQFVAFNGVSLNSPTALSLENSVTGVTLESSTGAGIVTMLQGDTLDINGVQNQIGASGNLGEKETTIDTLRFAYKVEAGKLRVKVLDWGVLEPRRDIRIKVKRGTNEISIHTLNIKSPTKVEGDTNLKFDNTYQIRNNVKFNAINLETYGRLSMQSLQGVILENTTGSGIPFMNQGDKIYVSDNFTARRNRRAVFADNYYEIGASGTLAKQNIKLTNGEVGVQVEGGKLNLALNNWTVNKNVNVRVQIVRGTNQIMDHTFTLKAPDAPFNVISQGVLDFGTIIAGAKNRTAETDVKIEMIKDVTDIQFKLNTDSPELYNKNGTTLRARNLQALVRQQANRRYLVKIQGKLDVPENQELGEYSGSLILEMKIK